MKLQDTVEMMNSADYKERFKGELYLLKLRIDVLSKMIEDYREGKLKFEPKCENVMLESQLFSKATYESVLKMRAEIEDIELEQIEEEE